MQQLISTHTHTKLPPLCVQTSQACGGTAREDTRQSTLPTLAAHTRAREEASFADGKKMLCDSRVALEGRDRKNSACSEALTVHKRKQNSKT